MAGLNVPLPKPTILQPGEEEKQLVQGYRDESQGLENRLTPIREQMGTLENEMRGISDSMPRTPQLQPVQDFQPRQIQSGEMMAFATMATVLASLGASLTRTGMVGALNAAAGAIKGYNEGNIQQAKIDQENFQMQMRATIANNNRILEEYSAVLNDRKLTLAQRMQQYSVLAHKYNDEIAISAIKKGDLRFELERLDKVRNAQNQVEMMYARIEAGLSQRLAALENAQEPLVPTIGPGGKHVYTPRSKAIGMEVPPSSSARPPPAEIMRMSVAIGAAHKALDNYQTLLRDFDPRGWDQLSPQQRAKFESAVSALQLEWKEAAALGALTGPDLDMMEKTLVSPTSLKGAYYGTEGLTEQINQARGYFSRRRDAIQSFYPEIGGGGAPRPAPNSQYREGQTATGPGGARIVFRNGRWVPM